MPAASDANPLTQQSDAHPLMVVGFMVLLAGLDFGGTMLAKEWTTNRAAWQLMAGAATFLALFVVLVSGLRYAEMSVLTLGWIVVLQLAVIVVDRSRYGTTLTRTGWLAMLAILVLQGYLVLGAGTRSNDDSGSAVQSTAASADS